MQPVLQLTSTEPSRVPGQARQGGPHPRTEADRRGPRRAHRAQGVPGRALALRAPSRGSGRDQGWEASWEKGVRFPSGRTGCTVGGVSGCPEAEATVLAGEGMSQFAELEAGNRGPLPGPHALRDPRLLCVGRGCSQPSLGTR
uniref:Uncharacterized protein n=1 Tax=Myotis myotis TaxID=51298 RepID=A0A7J7Z5J7_MYOMY|nr:hypothetical protein mMyoMyo1_010812 [Myotis myotis]